MGYNIRANQSYNNFFTSFFLLQLLKHGEEEEDQATDRVSDCNGTIHVLVTMLFIIFYDILLRIEEKLDDLSRLEAKVDRVFNLLQGQNVCETIAKVTVKDEEFVVCHLKYTHHSRFSGRSLATMSLQNALILSVYGQSDIGSLL